VLGQSLALTEHQLLNHVPMYIRQPKISALKWESQSLMIDSHQPQYRRLQVMYVDRTVGKYFLRR